MDRSIIGADPTFCVEDIEKADFVALRFDMSEYLFQTVKPNLSMEEYFRLHVEQMQQPPEFELPQRLGICCGVWNPFDRCFQLSSYDLGLFPGFWQSGHLPKRCGPQRVHARRFIHEKVKAKKNRWEEYMSSTVVMVLKALRAAKCPLLVYDGLTDLIQLFDKFLGPVGTTEECFDQWLQHFPAIYDVKWMALQDPPGDADVLVPPGLEKWRQEDPTKVTLAGLWRAIYCSPWTKRGRLPLRFRETGDRNYRAQSVLGLGNRPTGIEGEGYMGRMTMMIAEIFVMLNDYRMPPMKKEDLKPSKVTKKQRRELTKKFADVGSTTLPDSADEVTETPTFSSASPTLKAPVDSRKRKFSEDGEAVPSPATPPEALELSELSELSERSTERAAEPAAKRPRRPRCLTRVRQIESVVDAFARNLVNQRTEEDIDVTDAYGMELLERCASNCRFFRNVLCASGTPQGGVALDAQLVRGAVLEYENLEDL